MEERYMGSNPTSPTIDPSRLMGRGRKGMAFDLSEGSTMESHKRSGIALRLVLVDGTPFWVKAAADPAKRADMAMAKDFMV